MNKAPSTRTALMLLTLAACSDNRTAAIAEPQPVSSPGANGAPAPQAHGDDDARTAGAWRDAVAHAAVGGPSNGGAATLPLGHDTTGPQSVLVVNDATQLLPVSIAGAPSVTIANPGALDQFTLVSSLASAVGPAGGRSMTPLVDPVTLAPYAIPSGKLAVVDGATAYCQTAPGRPVSLFLALGPILAYPIPMTPPVVVGESLGTPYAVTTGTVTLPVRIPAGGANAMTMTVEAPSTTQGFNMAACLLTVSGHLVNAS